MPNKPMGKKTFHGPVSPADFADALVAEFNQGNLEAKRIGSGNQRIVQIATPRWNTSGGRTAITIHLNKVEDGVHVQLGEQEWFGVAASLGMTALMALRSPWSLAHRIDDLAQDITSLQLTTRIWQTITRTAEALGLSYNLSERLRRLSCDYCNTANPVGAPHCVSCGAPLGPNQPVACGECGYILSAGTKKCSQCGAKLKP
ncbi:MAG: zinc ribbon domain-containing protein [Anaerolineales bacterium]